MALATSSHIVGIYKALNVYTSLQFSDLVAMRLQFRPQVILSRLQGVY